MKLDIGKSLHIRSYEETDVAAVARHADNRNIWINLTDRFPHPYTEADARKWIQYVQQKDPETNFAIASETEVIGGIGFELLEDVHCKTATIGYWLGESFWGKGIVTRALRALTTYAFSHYDLVRISAGVFEYNPASARVLEKVGYTYEARLRRHVFKDGKIADMLLYAILKNEWENRT